MGLFCTRQFPCPSPRRSAAARIAASSKTSGNWRERACCSLLAARLDPGRYQQMGDKINYYDEHGIDLHAPTKSSV
jgi:hypothetical protein